VILAWGLFLFVPFFSGTLIAVSQEEGAPMPDSSNSNLIGMFWVQILFFVGPGAVALLDLWWTAKRKAELARFLTQKTALPPRHEETRDQSRKAA